MHARDALELQTCLSTFSSTDGGFAFIRNCCSVPQIWTRHSNKIRAFHSARLAAPGAQH